MIPELTLKRAIKVRRWRVVGQVSKASKRPELLPLLLRVADRGRSNARDIAEHLFFEARSRRVVAERMLAVGVAYRLLEEHQGEFTLSEEGRRATETKRVFVPERGTWDVWASDDPVLGSRILRVDAWDEPSALSERHSAAGDDKRRFERLPSWLREVVGRVQQPCVGPDSLRFDGLEERGETVPADAAVLVEWQVAEDRLRAKGTIGDKRVESELDAPNRSPEEVWEELLRDEGLWLDWDTTKGALLVAFEDTEGSERNSMTRRLPVERPNLEGLGTFDELVVEGVPIAEQSRGDARQWARWRLEDRIRDYATERRMEEWRRAACEPFADPIDLPSRSELARDAWQRRPERPSPRIWHLVAADDWGLR